jgi:hypothetical protein
VGKDTASAAHLMAPVQKEISQSENQQITQDGYRIFGKLKESMGVSSAKVTSGIFQLIC